MIEVKSLVKTFDGFRALDGTDITVPDGGVYGLVGPNGAGKSTVIRHLTGIYRPDGGQVLVEGESVYENPGKKALMAAIPDDWYYFPSATIRDMMHFYQGFYPAFDTARYEKFKDVFALPEKSPIRRMSKGMQKQAAFWLAMCCRPKYLILDEPVDGLDPVMRRQVWSLMMSDVSEHGTTVLVSSHNLRELEDVCDHVGIMNKGKVLLERSLSDLQENIVKLQAVWRTGEVPVLPTQMQVLHTSHVGRVYTYIVRGTAKDITGRLEQFQPMMLEALPLSLEEIFIYELGGEQYAVKEIIL
ncbi:MAG: ABC transporter ATP-binding protein [Oscillospiraceae bacterium]|jgi:ABC-2 type transport system ATP-binding protein|nr:ABC transporter ATP-binding protein [Oscillospiraceae bacterium]